MFFPADTPQKVDKARFRRRSTHVPNLTEVLSTAKERRLNQFSTAVLIWCGKNVKFHRVCRMRVSMGLTDSRKTAKNLVDSRKN